MAAIAYVRGMEAVLNGTVRLGGVTVKALLTTAAYVPNIATHAYRGDVAPEAAPVSGYLSGGVNATAVVVRDEANNCLTLVLGAAAWTVPAGQTLVGRRLVHYVSTGNAATDWLLACNSLDADFSATNRTLTIGATSVVFDFAPTAAAPGATYVAPGYVAPGYVA